MHLDSNNIARCVPSALTYRCHTCAALAALWHSWMAFCPQGDQAASFPACYHAKMYILPCCDHLRTLVLHRARREVQQQAREQLHAASAAQARREREAWEAQGGCGAAPGAEAGHVAAESCGAAQDERLAYWRALEERCAGDKEGTPRNKGAWATEVWRARLLHAGVCHAHNRSSCFCSCKCQDWHQCSGIVQNTGVGSCFSRASGGTAWKGCAESSRSRTTQGKQAGSRLPL